MGLPQVKLAWIAVGGPARLVDQALERLEIICDTYLSVSTPVQVAAPELLERGASVREQIAAPGLGQLPASAREGGPTHVTPALPRARDARAAGRRCSQVPSLESEEDLVVDLLQDDGVLAHPGYFFDFPRESYLVVSLLVSEAQFAEGTDRVLRHFDCPVASHE